MRKSVLVNDSIMSSPKKFWSGNWLEAHQFYGKSRGKFNIFLCNDR